MRARICPRCNSPDISLAAGGVMGIYECRNCGYRGSLVIDKDFLKKS